MLRPYQRLLPVLGFLACLAAGCLPPAPEDPNDLPGLGALRSGAAGASRAPAEPEPELAMASMPHLLDPATEALYRGFLPANLKHLRSADLLWYDERVMPELYQVFDRGGQSGVIRADAGQVSANNEFPWSTPAGTVAGSNFKAARFVKLAGMEWWREVRGDGTFAGFRWRYAPGTQFGEMILVTGPDGRDHAAVVRLRTKRSNGTWQVNQLVPFPTREDLSEALAARGITLPDVPARPEQLNSGHQRNAFVADGLVEPLPDLPADLVAELLDTTPFRSQLGKAWRAGEEGQADVVAPTCGGFGIYPRGWLGAFLPVDSDSCMRCHKDAGHVVNLQGETRWRLRGDDAIFSFHPFEPSSVGGQLELRRELVEAGLLTHRPDRP